MRIVLINTGNDDEIGGNANSQSYPPLSIISLATALENAFGDRVELALFDGQVDPVEVICSQLRRIGPDLVGISMFCTSIRNTIRLVQEAKACGATTILGNDHAAIHCQTLLDKVPDIDYICTGDVGEDTLTGLVACLLENGEPATVSNLAFRAGGRIMRTGQATSQIAGRRNEVLNRLPIPNRTLLPERYWTSYLTNFKLQRRRTFDSSKVTGVATINRARGCARAMNPCRYCGIADLSPRGSSGEVFWQDVRLAREQIGATVLYEAFDSATSWPALVASWLEARPEDMADTRLFMYAQAAETQPRIVEIFSRLGVFCVNVGFDSGDTRALQLLKGRRDSAAANRRAAELWTDAGIEIHTSFVLSGLGSEAETRRSLDQTLEFAEWLAAATHTVSLDSAIFYPDRTAVAGAWIWDPGLAGRQAKELGWDFLDMDLLQKMSDRWRDEVYLDPLALANDFARVCGVEPEVLVEYHHQIQNISSRFELAFGHSLAGAEPVPVAAKTS
jgi:anaerobic magnesium-protoporphyrin IX monomethyl ester cyclase